MIVLKVSIPMNSTTTQDTNSHYIINKYEPYLGDVQSSKNSQTGSINPEFHN